MNLGKKLLLAAVLVTAPFAVTAAGAQDRRDTSAQNVRPDRDQADRHDMDRDRHDMDRDRHDRDRDRDRDRDDRGSHYGWRHGHHYGWYHHHHCMIRWHHHHRVRICR